MILIITSDTCKNDDVDEEETKREMLFQTQRPVAFSTEKKHRT